jgi:hypothetical protein
MALSKVSWQPSQATGSYTHGHVADGLGNLTEWV